MRVRVLRLKSGLKAHRNCQAREVNECTRDTTSAFYAWNKKRNDEKLDRGSARNEQALKEKRREEDEEINGRTKARLIRRM